MSEGIKGPIEFEVTDPLVVITVEGDDHEIITRLCPGDYSYAHMALAVCDLVRHIAKCFKVPEDAVWKVVNRERHNPTTEIRQPS